MKFEMNQNEVDAYRKWRKKHDETCVDKGSRRSLTFMFTPTGIGTGIEVLCPCGEKVDVTDIDSW